jgi:hypothetical protein
MKTIFLLLISSLVFISCETKNNDQEKTNFTPSISYVVNGELTEVRLNLPNGGSKIIFQFNEPILESGKKHPYQKDVESQTRLQYKIDSTYKLKNTSFCKTSGGRYNLIYLFQKKEKVIISMEVLEIQGFVDSKLLFNANILNVNNDPLTEAKSSNTEETIQKLMIFVSDDNSNEHINLILDGKDVSMEIYRDNEINRIIKGTYINQKLLMDDEEVSYVLTDKNLCYHLEGYDYCYTKTSEKILNN